MGKPKAVITSLVRPTVEAHCGALDVVWFDSAEQALEVAPQADIGWFDLYEKDSMPPIIAAATRLKWLNSIYAGVDHFPLDQLKRQGTVLTNGAGLNSSPIAEFAVMGMLAAAKRTDILVAEQRARRWIERAPGTVELTGSSALILGYGGIGRQIARKLSGFDMTIVAVRRSVGNEPSVIGVDQWRDRLGEFDWVILSAPATDETRQMIGADELAAMKSSAWLINVARGSLVDQTALRHALYDKTIGGAVLDVTDPEPLPDDDRLWDAPNCLITMHVAGIAQTRIFERAAERFVDNLKRYQNGDDMIAVADFDRGY